MSKTYELNVSREGIVKSLKDQFTDRFTFLQEALQNARRAGASAVQLVLDEANRVLDIIDDGNGIDDFESLLTLGESGWDMQTMETDYPYGVGFASLLMAADAVQIRTQDKAAFFFTDDLLAFKPVAVDTKPYQPGTHIRLWLKIDYKPASITYQLKERVEGFDLPVSLNGQWLDRPAALNNPVRHYIETSIGMVSLPLCHPTDMPDDAEVRAFVQGLPVEFDRCYKNADECILIHFAAHIRARMPDRDKLLNETDVRQQWNVVRRQLFADRLRYIKAHVPMRRFANDYWRSCAKWCPELLTDVPLAPSMLMACEDITPRLPDWHWQHEAALVSWNSARSLPRKGSLMLTGCFDAYENQLANLYALKKDLPVVEQALPVTHWAAKRTYDATDLPITYRIIGEEKTLSYKGSWIWVDVLFCEAIELSLDEERLSEFRPQQQAFLREQVDAVRVDDWGFYDEDNQVLVVPAKAQNLDELAGLCSSFIDGDTDDFIGHEHERDAGGLRTFIESIWDGDAAKVIQTQINRISVDSNLIPDDAAFVLQWDAKRHEFVVNELDKAA